MQNLNDNLNKTTTVIKAKREKFRVEFRKQNLDLLLNQKRNFDSLFSPTPALVIENPLMSIMPMDDSDKIFTYANDLYEAIENQDKKNIINNIRNLRSISCKGLDSQWEIIINTNIVPQIIKILGSKLKEYSEIQMECLWVLTNLSCSELKIIKYLIDNNILVYLKEVITYQDNIALVDQGIMCCANIASELEYRDQFFMDEFDISLQKILSTRKEDHGKSLYKNIAFFLANLTRKNKEFIDRNAQFLDTLAQFLYLEDEETIIESIWAIFNISELDFDYLLKIIGMGIMTKIIKNLLMPNDKIKWASLRLISLIAGGPDFNTEILYQNNIYVYISGILDSPRSCMRKEALYIISNLVAEDKENYLEIFIDSDIFHKVTKILILDEFVVVKEGIYVLTNFVFSATPSLIKKFVFKGGLKICIDLINKFIEEREEFMHNLLKSIDKILGTEGKNEMEFIREFVDNGGVQVLRKGKNQLCDMISEKYNEIYQKYIQENYI